MYGITWAGYQRGDVEVEKKPSLLLLLLLHHHHLFLLLLLFQLRLLLPCLFVTRSGELQSFCASDTEMCFLVSMLNPNLTAPQFVTRILTLFMAKNLEPDCTMDFGHNSNRCHPFDPLMLPPCGPSQRANHFKGSFC